MPVYRDFFTMKEASRLRHTLSNVGDSHVYLVGPSHLDFSHLVDSFPTLKVARFADKNFVSRASYSEFLLNRTLYEFFSGWDFSLICQLDALIDQPPDWSSFQFDYCGAPWEKPPKLVWDPLRRKLVEYSGPGSRKVVVGNGGLSLRRNKAMVTF